MMTLYEITPKDMERLWPVNDTVKAFGLASEPLIVAMWNATPACFVGFVPRVGEGYIWMETLPAAAEHKLAIGRHAKDLIHRALERWPRIVGHCNAPSSIRWMKSLGAKFITDNPPGFEILR
jgi:hypothetical protein